MTPLLAVCRRRVLVSQHPDGEAKLLNVPWKRRRRIRERSAKGPSGLGCDLRGRCEGPRRAGRRLRRARAVRHVRCCNPSEPAYASDVCELDRANPSGSEERGRGREEDNVQQEVDLVRLQDEVRAAIGARDRCRGASEICKCQGSGVNGGYQPVTQHATFNQERSEGA